MSRPPPNAGLLWVALHSWAVCLVAGLLILLYGAVLGDEDTKHLITIGSVALFVLTPLLALLRLVMPRSWKRSMYRRGSRRI